MEEISSVSSCDDPPARAATQERLSAKKLCRAQITLKQLMTELLAMFHTNNRKYEYECDLDMIDGRKLEQRRLSFATDTLIHVAGNTNKGHLGTLKSDASKGAKNKAGTAQNGRNVIDEK